MKNYNNWKKLKSKNPYIPHKWHNKKNGKLLEIHYDIDFGNQRNVTIYDTKNQTLSGLKAIHTEYLGSPSEAMEYAKMYMMRDNGKTMNRKGWGKSNWGLD